MNTSTFFTQTLVTLLVIVDPLAVIPTFMNLTRHETAETQAKIARKSCIIGLVLMLSFAVIGDLLFDAMNISEPAFRIAGGFLLFIAALDMVLGRGGRSPTRAETEEAIHRDDISVFPLAIPLISGPGALTSVVVLMRQGQQISFFAQIGVVLITIGVIGLTYLTLRMARPIMSVLGVTGTNVLTRVFGIILCAVALQSIINGILLILKSF